MNIQEKERIPNRLNPNKTISRYVIIKLSKVDVIR